MTRAHDLARSAAQEAASLPPLLVEAERVATSVLGGVHGRRRPGQGDSFWEYRPLRPGESASRIDWRRSARDGRMFVRETEWEAAQTVCLWNDRGPRMGWRSSATLPRKSDRAALLLLALASLLLRAGEHPRLVEPGGTLSPASFGGRALERLALFLERHAGAAPDPAPQALAMPPHARAVLFGDFLEPGERTAETLAALHARPLTGVLVMLLDPAEASLPFRGRVRFRGLDGSGGGELLAPRAEGLRDAYAARLAEHQQRLQSLATEAGFGFVVHHTDHPPGRALIDLHDRLTARR